MFVVQFIKYLFVGGCNAVLTCIVFYALLKGLHIHYLIALTFAWILGLVFTYILNFIWVFKPEDQFRFQTRFFKYFFIYLSSFLVNLVSLHYLVQFSHADPFYVQMLLMPFIVVINYLFTKHWSLKRYYQKGRLS